MSKNLHFFGKTCYKLLCLMVTDSTTLKNSTKVRKKRNTCQEVKDKIRPIDNFLYKLRPRNTGLKRNIDKNKKKTSKEKAHLFL